MHRSPAALRAARRAAEELREQCAGRDALGQGMTVAAMRAEDHVVSSQMSGHPRRNRLLADVGMTGAMDQSLLVRPAQAAPRSGGSRASS